MPTKQLPFFLNSAKGSNLTPLGNAFDVKLDPPVKIPADARDTRIFVQSDSAVYSFPNVTLENNKIELFYQSAGPPGTNTIGFSLTVVPGLYATCWSCNTASQTQPLPRRSTSQTPPPP
jgi:hypothetical protein